MKTTVFGQEIAVVVVVVKILTFLVSASSDDVRNSDIATSFYDDDNNDVTFQSAFSSHVYKRDIRAKWMYLLNISSYNDTKEDDVIKNVTQSNSTEQCSNSNGWNLKGSDWGCCGNYEGCCTYASFVCYIHDAMCRCCDVSASFCGPKCRPENDCSVLNDVSKMLSDSAAVYSDENNVHDVSDIHDSKSDVMATSSFDSGSDDLEGSGETIYKPEVPD